MPDIISTRTLAGRRVVDARKGKRIGKVRHFVFHPSEKRCVGFVVKRPDAALMFHRKDLFVALGSFHEEDGQLVVHDNADATDRGAARALGVDLDSCVIWVGMPVLAESDAPLGYVGSVTFDAHTGAVRDIAVENGAANDVILGKRTIPAAQVLGFKRGIGETLAGQGEDENGNPSLDRLGAILVSTDAKNAPSQGGVAAAAGKASAIVADKAKKGATMAKKDMAQRAEKARPAVKRASEKAEGALASGSYAVGKQLGRASGMFAAFKEEFEKASKGEDD